jgi:hypothetical protein
MNTIIRFLHFIQDIITIIAPYVTIGAILTIMGLVLGFWYNKKSTQSRNEVPIFNWKIEVKDSHIVIINKMGETTDKAWDVKINGDFKGEIYDYWTEEYLSFTIPIDRSLSKIGKRDQEDTFYDEKISSFIKYPKYKREQLQQLQEAREEAIQKQLAEEKALKPTEKTSVLFNLYNANNILSKSKEPYISVENSFNLARRIESQSKDFNDSIMAQNVNVLTFKGTIHAKQIKGSKKPHPVHFDNIEVKDISKEMESLRQSFKD